MTSTIIFLSRVSFWFRVGQSTSVNPAMSSAERFCWARFFFDGSWYRRRSTRRPNRRATSRSSLDALAPISCAGSSMLS
eukprot:5626737-Prymnesium_polylepis.1